MKKKKTIITSVVIALALVGGVAFFVSKGKTEDPKWLTVKVSRGDLDVVVTATGTVAADTTIQVGTQVSGTIAQLFVDWNSRVRKGQIMAKLDTTFLWASVEVAESNLQKAKVAADQAKVSFDRVKQLFDRNLDSQADYDAASATYESAEADVKTAQTALDQAHINLNYATIRAPISGVVISRAVDLGQTVAASFSTPTLFTIANDLSRMQVQALVDEGDVGNVKVGQIVTFTVDAYPTEVFKGSVSQIRLQPTTVQNVVEYTVIIEAPNPGLRLMPGMTANITINIAEAKDVLKVPTTALRFTPPTDYLKQMMSQLPDSIKQKMQQRWKQNGNGNSGTGSGGGMNSGMGGGQSAQTRDLTPGSYFRVWIVDGKQIKSVRVLLGLSDGTNTEVQGDIKEDDDVAVGTLTQSSSTQSNPFAPGGQRRF
ncbi:MAG TPA: efflux RND transporter periplasmic adaptor subunit [Candidatus Acidoferrales bacterium]|nr:efflux RND transporter periplasmic adaptor subunit [Candidatus Acidoferrales bacterium]